MQPRDDGPPNPNGLNKDGLLAQDQSLEKLDLYWERAKRSEQ